MKLFFAKLAFLFFIILVLQTLIVKSVPYPPPEAITLLDEYRHRGIDIVYFGDSTTTWYSKFDTDIRSMPVMVQDILGKPIGAVTHNSYHAWNYDVYTEYMVRHGYNPSWILIPINLRSFPPEWDQRPNFQFTDESLYLSLYKSPFLPLLSFLVNITVPEMDRLYRNIYLAAPYYDGSTKVGNGADYERKVSTENPDSIRMPAMVQMFYLGDIAPTHRKLQNFIRITERFRSGNTHVVFYITPIDYQAGEQYFGPRFTVQLRKNVQTVMQILKQHEADVIDLSLSRPTEDFSWHEVWYINEHLTATGRASVSAELVKHMASVSATRKN